MWDNFEKFNLSTGKSARFDLEKHFFKDFTGVKSPNLSNFLLDNIQYLLFYLL